MRKKRSLLTTGILAMLLATAALVGWSAPASPAPVTPPEVGDVGTSFSATRDGFAFVNHSALGRRLAGLCGGMSYGALDYYRAGVRPAASGIDAFLIARNTESVVANGASFLTWTLAPDARVAASTRAAELVGLERALRAGPVPLGLVKAADLRHIGANHQVVAYALEREDTTVRVRVYDPNHPGSDDTYLTLDTADADKVVEYDRGEPVDAWRGFFVERYSPVRPPS